MGSHRRSAGAAAVLGSEAIGLLAHSKIPVVVCR
jgi:nucleotide-binding universal stress UspA family protein